MAKIYQTELEEVEVTVGGFALFADFGMVSKGDWEITQLTGFDNGEEVEWKDWAYKGKPLEVAIVAAVSEELEKAEQEYEEENDEGDTDE
jgi:hypothetical protein